MKQFKVSNLGRVTIPAKIRKKAGLEDGMPVDFEVTEAGDIVIIPQNKVQSAVAAEMQPCAVCGKDFNRNALISMGANDDVNICHLCTIALVGYLKNKEKETEQ